MEYQAYYMHYRKSDFVTISTVATVENDGIPNESNPESDEPEYYYTDNLPEYLIDPDDGSEITDYGTVRISEHRLPDEVWYNNNTGLVERKTRLESVLVIPRFSVNKGEDLVIGNVPQGTRVVIEPLLVSTAPSAIPDFIVDDNQIVFNSPIAGTFRIRCTNRPRYEKYTFAIEVVNVIIDENNLEGLFND